MLTKERALELLKKVPISQVREMVRQNEIDQAADDYGHFIEDVIDNGWVALSARTDEDVLDEEACCWEECEESDLISHLGLEGEGHE